MSELANRLRGRFIVVDGPDGAGKSTQLRLLAGHLAAEGVSVEQVMDPGTTEIGKKIRSLLLDRDNGEICPTCETLLFMASRAQLVFERVKPAIEQGKVVLCDRFITATLAYQGASGVSQDMILKLGEIAVQGKWPDLTVILDIPIAVGMDRIGIVRDRIKKTVENPAQLLLFGDRMEIRKTEYHEKVRELFREVGKVYLHPVRLVDASGSKDQVHARMWQALSEQFK
jgi:dTMP kinase